MSEVKQKKGWLARLVGRGDAPPEPETRPEPGEPELPPGLPPEVVPEPDRPDIAPPVEPTPPGPTEVPTPQPPPEVPVLDMAETPTATAEEQAGERGWFGFRRRGAAQQPPKEVPPGPEVQPEPELPPGLPEETPEPELPPEAVPEPEIPGEAPGEPEIPTEIPPPEAQEAGEEPRAEALSSEALEMAEAPVEEPTAEKPRVEGGWFARLRSGLFKSSSRLTQGITDLFTKRRLDDEALEDLEELLITADLGVATAARVSKRLAKARFGSEVVAEEVRAALAEEITEILEPVAQPLEIDHSLKPHVVLVVGVNGSGKTTTIGKLAKQYKDAGLSVTLAAGDTFRAAAVEQLKVWGQRTDCPVIARDTGADAAGLAFDALAEARKRGDDVLLIDTAGRLQNKTYLMAELQKVVKVIRKQDETAPHTVLLVLDATVGQNAHSQVEVFREMTNVSGLVLTKLDGTARGGVLVALAEKFGLPVHAIGIGERAEDLRPFKAADFARSLVGL